MRPLSPLALLLCSEQISPFAPPAGAFVELDCVAGSLDCSPLSIEGTRRRSSRTACRPTSAVSPTPACARIRPPARCGWATPGPTSMSSFPRKPLFRSQRRHPSRSQRRRRRNLAPAAQPDRFLPRPRRGGRPPDRLHRSRSGQHSAGGAGRRHELVRGLARLLRTGRKRRRRPSSEQHSHPGDPCRLARRPR